MAVSPHAERYRAARLRLDAALRARASDDVTAVVWSDGDVSVRARLHGDADAPAGRAPVLVYVDGRPLWTAAHPLPERGPQRARTFAGVRL